jgi:hypothetical protein
MDQGVAIVLAGLVGGGASLGAQQWVERQRLRRHRIQLVEELGAEALALANLVTYSRPSLSSKRTTPEAAAAVIDRMGAAQTRVVRAHTAVVVHCEAAIVDLASPVLDAASALIPAALDEDRFNAALRTLGQRRLRLLAAVRTRRLGLPKIIAELPSE